MKKIEIYDPALCCSTGVCGDDADRQLVEFAADIDWAKEQGAAIERHNFGQDPAAFAENSVVKGFLDRSGHEGLPLIIVDGEIALTGRYPERAELSRWLGLAESQAEAKAKVSCCGSCS